MKQLYTLLILAGIALQSTAAASTIDGLCLEDWNLMNFQPASPMYRQRVSSSAYRARTTLVALVASW